MKSNIDTFGEMLDIIGIEPDIVNKSRVNKIMINSLRTVIEVEMII